MSFNSSNNKQADLKYGIFIQNDLLNKEVKGKQQQQRTALLGQIVKIVNIETSGAVTVQFLKDGETWESQTFVSNRNSIWPVNEKLWDYLHAIPSPVDRVKLAINEELCEKLCNLSIDSTVRFLDKNEEYVGQLKSKGSVKGMGKCVGIKLNQKKINNKCNGSCAGIQYFNCLPGYGVFTTIDKILPITYNRTSSPPSPPSVDNNQLLDVCLTRNLTSFCNNDNNKPKNEEIVTKYGEYPPKTTPLNNSSYYRNSLSLQNILNVNNENLSSNTTTTTTTVNTNNDFDQNSVIQHDKTLLINGQTNKKKMKVKSEIDLVDIIGNSWTGNATNTKLFDKKPTIDNTKIESNNKSLNININNNNNKNKISTSLAHMFDNNNTLTKTNKPAKFYVNYTDYGDLKLDDVSNGRKINEKADSTTSIDNYHTPPTGTTITNGLTVGCLVEVSNDITESPLYGVVRWIGVKNNTTFVLVGVELEEEQSHLPLTLTDGTHNGERFFKCGDNRALFVPLQQCHKDSRFQDGLPTPTHQVAADLKSFEKVECPVIQGAVAPLCMPTEEDVEAVCAKFRGIQGHHNSCYLDVTLFAMFTYTSVFDSLLFRPKDSNDIEDYQEVQRVLREEIVNPLRKNLFVSADHVMNLRKLLDKLSSVSGLMSEEKDPEEFLNSLLAQILKAEPFLKLNSGQEAYYYQLFVEKDADLTLPTVQQLFEQSFLTSNIKLKEVPSCLIIQMPRFGKNYKMYPRILPSQLLDVTDVIEGSPRQCIVCGKLAKWECRECFDDCSNAGLESTAFCMECLKTAHRNERRSHHRPVELDVSHEFLIMENHCQPPRLFMELFAVICIETSHYVTFVKCGVGHEAPWCFFDSMADRKGEKNGYNIPEMVACPDISKWLSDEHICRQLHEEFPNDRHLPEHARRLLCDAYICMYQSSDVMMYR